MSLPSSQPKQQHISDLIRQLIATPSDEDRVTIGYILQLFGVRGFAFLLLMLSLLNVVIFMIPFSSFLFGLPMVILSVQMVLGFKAPIFPYVIRRQTIPRAALMQGLQRALYGMEKVERYIKPRWMFLTHPSLDRVHGLLALIMAILVTLPIPLFNIPPSLGLGMLAIGMLQRDGLFIVLAYAIGVWCFLLFRSLGHLAHSWARGS